MRECEMWKGALAAYCDGGWDNLWLYLNGLARRYGLEDGELWKIAEGVKKDALYIDEEGDE